MSEKINIIKEGERITVQHGENLQSEINRAFDHVGIDKPKAGLVEIYIDGLLRFTPEMADVTIQKGKEQPVQLTAENWTELTDGISGSAINMDELKKGLADLAGYGKSTVDGLNGIANSLKKILEYMDSELFVKVDAFPEEGEAGKIYYIPAADENKLPEARFWLNDAWVTLIKNIDYSPKGIFVKVDAFPDKGEAEKLYYVPAQAGKLPEVRIWLNDAWETVINPGILLVDPYFIGKNDATTLENIPDSKEVIICSEAAATTLSGTVTRHKVIRLTNTSEADFDQPLPNADGWESAADKVTVLAGKSVILEIFVFDATKTISVRQ